MAYQAKYRINPSQLNQFRNMAYNDPMFALGELIGRGYMQNYEDRGVRKALEKVEAQYGDGEGPSTNDMNQALDTVKNRYEQEAKGTLGFGLDPTANAAQMQAKKAELGVQNPAGQAVFAMNPLNDPSNFQGESEFNKRMRAEAQQRQAEMAALKTLGAVPMTNIEMGNRILDQYAGKLQAARDPQTGGITGIVRTPNAAELAEQAYNKRMADFNAKEEMSNIVAQMERDGRSPEQIARVTDAMEGKLQGMQDKYHKARAADIVGGLSKFQYDTPEYYQQIAELSKYDPSMAQAMGNYGRTMWDRQTKLDDEARKRETDKEDYRTMTGLAIERDNAVLENKVAQLKTLGLSDKEARTALLIGNRSGGSSGGGRSSGGGGGRSSGGGGRRSGGGRSSGGSSKRASWQIGIENLTDQTRGLLSQGNTTQARENIAALYSKWEDPEFREKLDSEDLDHLYQTIAALNYMNAVVGGYADSEEAQARLKEGKHILRAWGVI